MLGGRHETHARGQRLVDLGSSDDQVFEIIAALPCQVEVFDRAAGVRAGLLRRENRKQSLSLGDRACIELAVRMGRPAVTADHAWANVDVGVEVVLIR